MFQTTNQWGIPIQQKMAKTEDDKTQFQVCVLPSTRIGDWTNKKPLWFQLPKPNLANTQNGIQPSSLIDELFHWE